MTLMSLSACFFSEDPFRAAFAMLALPSQNFVIHQHQGTIIENDGSSLSDLLLINSSLLSIEMMDDLDQISHQASSQYTWRQPQGGLPPYGTNFEVCCGCGTKRVIAKTAIH